MANENFWAKLSTGTLKFVVSKKVTILTMDTVDTAK